MNQSVSQSVSGLPDVKFPIIICISNVNCRSALSGAFSSWEILLGEYEKEAQVSDDL